MVLSNAERQARHRARLKAKASGEALAERVRESADAALSSLWEYFRRENYGDVDGIESRDAFAAQIASAAEGGGLIDYCRDCLRTSEDMLPSEVAALQLVVDIADAITLADLKPVKRTRR